MRRCLHLLPLLLSMAPLPAETADQALIVVDDRGGVSALPYYQALDLQPKDPRQELPLLPIDIPSSPTNRYSEADMLPVRSALLMPGTVERRVIQAPGLRPMFLVGDDEHSHSWLRRRADMLRELGAIGLVVNVESLAALETLRRLARGLILSPVTADDLAQRLGIRHYPVLITATGIEQ